MNVEIAHDYHKPIIYMVKNKEPQDFTLQGDGKKEDIPAKASKSKAWLWIRFRKDSFSQKTRI